MRTMVAVVLAVLGANPVALQAAVYYVDSSAGSDSNSGLSTSSAFASVAKVNSLNLAAGDSVLFKRGQTFSGALQVDDNGSASQRITIGAWSAGAEPVLVQATVQGDYVTLENLVIDHQSGASDAVRFQGAAQGIVRNMIVRNGTRDGIDASDADGLLVDNVEIHHFLNGSFGSEDDAHGIVATGTNGITIRNADIHHVSGDSFQSDPNRVAGNISTNIVIEDSVLWTGPLTADFNAGWRAGDSPGENAIDTKVLQTGFESAPRMVISFRNVTAHGWTTIPEIPNRAAFNLKEKITAVLDRVTVYDSEIAFRIRGVLGNADTTIKNAVVYDVAKAVRAEDDAANLKVYNSTFGSGITTFLQQAGGSGGVSTWDWRNNAFVGSKPSVASDSTNLNASSIDFVAASARNFQLPVGSSLIDRGATISSVTTDRNGHSRAGAYDVGAYEYGSVGAVVPNPPILTSVQ